MKKINSVKPTEAMLVDVAAKSMPGRVYNLAAGDPDLPVCSALKKAYFSIDIDGTHRYCSSVGLTELRTKLWKNPDEVIIANGAKQLIYMSLAAVTKPGDRVVIIGPCWASYMRICSLLGLEYELLTGTEENRWIPDADKVRQAVDSRTAAVLFNSPNNPTGVVYSEEYTDSLLEICRAADTWLIADEIYRYICSVPFKSLRGREGVIVIDGFSKCLNLTGWRFGYAVACRDIISAMTGIQSQMSGPPSTVIQNVINNAFEELEYSSFEDYRERIDILSSISKFNKAGPDGGFYFFLPIAERWKSSRELCDYMLKTYAIAITPGDDYGIERTVRISVASESADALREIIEPLKEI